MYRAVADLQVNVIFLLFGGTIQPNPPPWFVWLKWISPINYTFSALAQNEFNGREIICDGGGGASGGACYSSVCVDSLSSLQAMPSCGLANPYKNLADRQGDEVVSAYNIGAFTIAQNAGFLVALSAVFFVAGYIGLRFTGKPQMRFK